MPCACWGGLLLACLPCHPLSHSPLVRPAAPHACPPARPAPHRASPAPALFLRFVEGRSMHEAEGACQRCGQAPAWPGPGPRPCRSAHRRAPSAQAAPSSCGGWSMASLTTSSAWTSCGPRAQVTTAVGGQAAGAGQSVAPQAPPAGTAGHRHRPSCAPIPRPRSLALHGARPALGQALPSDPQPGGRRRLLPAR